LKDLTHPLPRTRNLRFLLRGHVKWIYITGSKITKLRWKTPDFGSGIPGMYNQDREAKALLFRLKAIAFMCRKSWKRKKKED